MPFTKHKNNYFTHLLKIALGFFILFHCVGAGSCQTKEERYDAQLKQCVLQGQEDMTLGSQCLIDILKTYPNEKFANLFLARIYERSNQLDEAEKTIDIFIAQYPKEGSGYNVRCEVLRDKNNFPAALTACMEAIRLEPENLGYQRDYASVKEKLSDFSGAEDTYQQILSKNPNDAPTVFALGRLYEITNRLDESIATYEKLLTLDFEFMDKLKIGIERLKVKREKQLKEEKPKSKAATNN